ncbi:NACHT domain-containing protein [uncultured Hymenobacter sp.]|uniref:NACHT domain-containing protein n=1 Tax=uncultured Hymenobacter sp. TaxID=170016 RepID=UPI0035CC512C
MDYQLENLGPEEFQHLAQALLIREHPNVQCFPVAQPDGGRDATSIRFVQSLAKVRHSIDSQEETIVYQIKFVRKPLAVTDAHAWLEDILKGEAKKIGKLIPQGVKQFILITNVPGTAHPGSGSIDKVAALLKLHMPCPAFVWWRNDINRRLDDAWNVKWSYPQVMTGPDIMRSLIENGMGEHKERRISTIKSFLVEQFLADEEVKFKQVELQNKLLDLFIDVPLVESTPEMRRYSYRSFGHARRAPIMDEEGFLSEAEVGASTMILGEMAQRLFPSIVLEGAPGQGKSTITQYVAQVYRMRLLEKDDELSKVEESHKNGKMYLPIKVDLRDLATWLSKKHPFDATNELQVPDKWQKNLESFLVFLIGYYSGNADFNTTDFHAIARTSSILLLFDGLDEVAEISQRKDVVDEIVRGTKKLKEMAASLQTVVTSRPAAFANSPGMPRDSFTYFRLGSLTKPLINNYAEKWMKSRHLEGKEKADIRNILRHKLDEPHIKELARNPMQLSILLGLIRSRGASLPDKRTSLYEQYVELFFSRESEKSPIIRDHRDLIIELHQYVAWFLHSETQLKKGNGSISTENLKKLLIKYLQKEGRNEDLAEKLLSGMVERVVALVSRVQGTYEFEVQPLREFFAAKYLYESAAYSPAGDVKPGTKPDIFDAIAKDFHWLNVTRFFAGCYSKGELPSLIDRLQVLASLDEYKFLNHPRLLTAILLSDWVFSQNVRSVREAISLIIQGTGLRYFISSQRGQHPGDVALQLPNENGREELVEK